MDERVIVFIAWGERHVGAVGCCIRESRLPPYPVVLITDEATPADGLPDAVRVMRRRFRFSGKERKAEVLASLPEEFRTVLFLDVDTRVIADISLGFEKAERHGLAMALAPHYSLADFRSFGRVMARENVQLKGQVIYNSGVMFFDWRSPAVREVFASALTLLLKDEAAPWSDQPYISLAMEMAGFNPYTLSPSFNYRNFGELISGSLRIWHSYSPLPPGAAALKPGYLHRYEGDTLVRVMEVPL